MAKLPSAAALAGRYRGPRRAPKCRPGGSGDSDAKADDIEADAEEAEEDDAEAKEEEEEEEDDDDEAEKGECSIWRRRAWRLSTLRRATAGPAGKKVCMVRLRWAAVGRCRKLVRPVDSSDPRYDAPPLPPLLLVVVAFSTVSRRFAETTW